jgi:hypothetical protein
LVAAIEGHHPSAESEGPRDALAQVGPAPAPHREEKDWIDADPAVAASDSELPVAIDLSIPAVEQRALPPAASDFEREFVVDISAKDVAGSLYQSERPVFPDSERAGMMPSQRRHCRMLPFQSGVRT